MLPIKDEVVNLRQSLEDREAGPSSKKRKGSSTVGSQLGEEAQRFVLRNKIQDATLDRTFGITYRMPEGWVIGNTIVRFQGNDIIIGIWRYTGTEGLWSLITDTQEAQIYKADPSNGDSCTS